MPRSKADRVKAAKKRAGVTAVNKPKRTPNHPSKSHVVVGVQGNKVKVVRFGQQGVRGAGGSPKSKAEKARRASFRARHRCGTAKDKTSARYWACRTKWQNALTYEPSPLHNTPK